MANRRPWRINKWTTVIANEAAHSLRQAEANILASGRGNANICTMIKEHHTCLAIVKNRGFENGQCTVYIIRHICLVRLKFILYVHLYDKLRVHQQGNAYKPYLYSNWSSYTASLHPCRNSWDSPVHSILTNENIPAGRCHTAHLSRTPTAVTSLHCVSKKTTMTFHAITSMHINRF